MISKLFNIELNREVKNTHKAVNIREVLTLGKGEGEMILENGIETCIISYVKQITSPGLMHETGFSGWCTNMAQRDGMGREVGGGFRMGNTCTPMAYSC